MEAAKRILVELLDVYPSAFDVNDFVPDGKTLSVDAIVRHPLARASVAYGRLWRTVYGTFPTKKHSHAAITTTVMMNPSFKMISTDETLSKIVHTLRQQWEDDPRCVFLRYCREKLAFRYGLLGSHECIFKAALSGIKSCVVADASLTKDVGFLFNPITRRWIEFAGWTAEDDAYMPGRFERVQYALYNDLHFMKRWHGAYVIQTLGKIDDDEYDVGTISDLACSKKNHHRVWMLGHVICSDLRHCIRHDDVSDDDWWRLLPKTASHHVCFVNDDHRSCPYSDRHLVVSYRGETNSARSCRVVEDDVDVLPKEGWLLIKRRRDDTVSVVGKTLRDVFTSKEWHAHVLESCASQDVGVAGFVDYLQRHAHRRLDRWTRPLAHDPASHTTTIPKLVVLLVDGRRSISSVASAALAFEHISRRRPNTEIEIWTSAESSSFYESWCDGWANVIHRADMDESANRFHIDVYNDLLMDVNTWTFLKQTRRAEYVLVIQDDGVITRDYEVRNFEEAFVEKYDYVGAPWASDVLTDCHVGNGGFSLRSVDAMIDVLQRPDCDFESRRLFFGNANNVPEDVFFSRAMHRHGKRIPDKKTAKTFSSEQLLEARSYGVHKPWPYHDPCVMKAFWNSRLALSE